MRRTAISIQPSAIKKLLVLLTLSYLTASALAQQNIPFIQATSKKIKVLDGDYLQDGELVPGLNPDTYHFRPSIQPKKIAYYTDKDSIVFRAKAGDVFHFGVVLNGDTCYQVVTSENPYKVHYVSSKNGQGNDTLPFILGPNNAIHLKGKINHSKELDLIFDTGASIGVLSEAGKDKGAELSSDNKNVFTIGNITVSNSPATYIDYKGGLKADGVIGHNAFEGKVVEINYDENIMVIHHGVFNKGGYASAEMKWRGSAMFIEGSIGTRNKKYNGLFLFDTGSKWALSLNKAFVVENKLYETMEKIGSRRARGADGKTIKSNTVILPALYIAGLMLPNVPIDIELPEQSEGSLQFNILGNDVLKRFNVLLDYKNSLVYLKPNSLQNDPYNKTLDEKDLLLLATSVLCIGLLIFFLYRKAKQQRAPHQQAA